LRYWIVTEDGLSSNAPHIETLHDYECHYILGVKEGDYAYLFEQVRERSKRGAPPIMSGTTAPQASCINFVSLNRQTSSFVIPDSSTRGFGGTE
jgi:hypothetical protein